MRASRPGWRYGGATLAAIAFSLLYLTVCARVGRLSLDLQYDDVGYALDAATRLEAAIDSGIPTALRLFRDIPPHSFLSTLQGMAAFALGGINDLALYASNGWMLLAIALVAAFALRRRPAAATGVVLAFVLTSPLCYSAIAEYRPDLALGFATALMAWMLLDAGFRRDARMARHAGWALGAALVIKPTFFAHTFALAACIAAAGLAVPRLARDRTAPPFALGVRAIAEFLAIGLAVALPFFLVNGAEVVEYFWTNAFGSKSGVWNYGSDVGSRELLARSVPLMAKLGHVHSAAAGVVAAALAAALWVRGDRTGAARVAATLLVAALSFAIIVAGRQPSHFFFATMLTLLVVAAVKGGVRFADGLRRGRGVLAAVVLAAVAALAVKDSTYAVDNPWPDARHGTSWNDRIVDTIAADLRRHAPTTGRPAANLVAFAASSVNPHTLIWVGRLHGVDFRAPAIHLLSDPQEARDLATRADYVVVPNVMLAPYDGWLPVGKVQGPMLEWLLANPQFEPLQAVDAATRYYVFANRASPAGPRTGAVIDAAGGVLSAEHLRNEEGPYPEHQPPLPRLRWIDGKSARLCLALAPRAYTVEADFVARGTGKLRLMHGSRQVAEASLVPEMRGTLRGAFEAHERSECLDFSIEAPDMEPPLYAMLTRLSIAPRR